VVLRRVLHGALLDAVGRDALVLESSASGFERRDGKIELKLAGGAPVRGDILIGADGAASAIRRALHPHERPPRKSGLFAIRAWCMASHKRSAKKAALSILAPASRSVWREPVKMRFIGIYRYLPNT
jgi:2-polyprenyl-6-methoxyphenol hydroxylase-like FAD-dependent oxidoreductase